MQQLKSGYRKIKKVFRMVFFSLPPCNNKHACLETKIIINVYPEKLNISMENKTKNIWTNLSNRQKNEHLARLSGMFRNLQHNKRILKRAEASAIWQGYLLSRPRYIKFLNLHSRRIKQTFFVHFYCTSNLMIPE